MALAAHDARRAPGVRRGVGRRVHGAAPRHDLRGPARGPPRRDAPRPGAAQCPVPVGRRDPERDVCARGDPGTCRTGSAASIRLPVDRLGRRLHRELAHGLGPPRGGHRARCRAARSQRGPAAGRARPHRAPARLQQLPVTQAGRVVDRPVDAGRHHPAQHPAQLAGAHPAGAVRGDRPPPVPLRAGPSGATARDGHLRRRQGGLCRQGTRCDCRVAASAIPAARAVRRSVCHGPVQHPAVPARARRPQSFDLRPCGDGPRPASWAPCSRT